MHIIADRFQIPASAAVHDQRLVTSAEQVAEEFMAAIEPRGVGAQEPAHPGDEVGVGRLHNKVKMIGQETERMNLPIGFGANLRQGREKLLVIQIVAEDEFAAVAPVHDVIDRAGIFDAQRSGCPVQSWA